MTIERKMKSDSVFQARFTTDVVITVSALTTQAFSENTGSSTTSSINCPTDVSKCGIENKKRYARLDNFLMSVTQLNTFTFPKFSQTCLRLRSS
jgi:hypothetical protein